MPNDNSRSHRRYRKLKKLFREQCARLLRVCWLCGQPIDYSLPKDHPDAFSLDHRFGWAEFPHLRYDPGNFEASHLDCNRRRGKKTSPASLGTLSEEW